jgi:hypothetical protein
MGSNCSVFKKKECNIYEYYPYESSIKNNNVDYEDEYYYKCCDFSYICFLCNDSNNNNCCDNFICKCDNQDCICC